MNFTINDEAIEFYLDDQNLTFNITNSTINFYLCCSQDLPDEDYRLLENDEIRITEDGEFRILQ